MLELCAIVGSNSIDAWFSSTMLDGPFTMPALDEYDMEFIYAWWYHLLRMVGIPFTPFMLLSMYLHLLLS